jgi:hypothetical protein
VTGVLGAIVAGNRRSKPIRAVFNVAAIGLSAALAARAYVSVPELLGLGERARPLGLLSAAVVFTVVNTVAVAVAIRLERMTPFLEVWRGFAVFALHSAVASVLVGLGLHALFTTVGAVGLVAGLSASVLLGAAIQTFRDRLETSPGPLSDPSS